VHIQTITLYENRDDVTLTTYVLDDSPEMLNGKKRPGVLICPGGGYLGCSDREAEPVALRFAAMGYHAFVLRYSTYGNGAPFAQVPAESVSEVNPNSVHPGPVRDIGRAFLELHAHADEWLLDVEKIAICGFSAGGHNCAMYSVYWNDPLITEHFGEDAEKFRPAAAILGYAMCDYRLRFGEVPDEGIRALTDAVSIAFLGTTSPSDALLEEVSPVLHITENTPPIFLWSTFEDGLVLAENSTRMGTALAQAGIPFELHIFEGGGHGLSLANQATAAYEGHLERDAAKWIELVEAWLKRHIALPVPGEPARVTAVDIAEQE